MDAKSVVFSTFALLALIAALGTSAFADAGVFTGNGQSLHQISTKNVQLVAIDVTIVPGRGRFLFDGTVPGMDRTEFYCTFVLKSLSANVEEVQIGFPVDSQFAGYSRNESPLISAKESDKWVSDYSFIARDEKTTYHVSFVRRKKEAASEFGELFTWEMSFAPKETRTLTVQYQLPMTMGLGSTRKDDNAKYELDSPLEQELLNTGMEEVVGYITSTGSSWAGNVENATITVITAPFEHYLDVRGIVEAVPTGSFDKQNDEDMRYRKNFPVRHPWWFRTISPIGWKRIEDGIQWHYQDYKPQNAIVVTYFMTEFPRLPEEVSAFVDQFLENISDNDGPLSGRHQLKPQSKVEELRRLKQLLIATYGREPDDDYVRQHVAGQRWYEPRKNFTIENLTKTQKAVLSQIDARIQNAKETQSSSSRK
jgi:hypothetical protein